MDRRTLLKAAGLAPFALLRAGSLFASPSAGAKLLIVFLRRLVGAMSEHHGMSFTDQLPLIFRGDMEVPNMALRTLAKPGVDARQSEIIREMYRGTRLEARVSEGFNVRDAVMRDMAGEME